MHLFRKPKDPAEKKSRAINTDISPNGVLLFQFPIQIGCVANFRPERGKVTSGEKRPFKCVQEARKITVCAAATDV